MKMGMILELVKARRRIRELEGTVADLSELLALGLEKPSVADIVQKTGILADNYGVKVIIDYHQLNIPFTTQPKILPIMDIPDTNSMDGLMDYGNNPLYIEPADETNHKIMVDWIAKQWLDSKGLQTVDAVTRIMFNKADDPKDFTEAHKWYVIHRLSQVGFDTEGRYFIFAGINNPYVDPFVCRDRNILFLNSGVIY